jgi:hypothetical protein
VLAGGICMAIVGFAHYQTQPRVAASKPPVSADVRPPTLVRSVAAPGETETAAALLIPARMPQQTSVPRRAPAFVPAKGAASSQPSGSSPRSRARARELSASVERLNDVPTLVSPPEPFVH